MPGNMAWRTDAECRCTWLSDALCSFVGQERERLLNGGLRDYVHEDDRERVVAEVAHAFRARHPFIVWYHLRRHDDTFVYMKARGLPWNDPITGEFCGYRGSIAPRAPALIDRGTTCASIVSIRQRIIIPPALLTPMPLDSSVELRS